MKLEKVIIDRDKVYKVNDIVSFRINHKSGKFTGRIINVNYAFDEVQFDCSDKYKSDVVNCKLDEIYDITLINENKLESRRLFF